MSAKLFTVALLASLLPCLVFGQWVAQPSNSTSTVNDIHFTTENTGFIGTTNSIYKTVNGGATWTFPQYPGGTLDVQLLGSAYIHDIHFFDQSNGLMTGSGFYNGYDIVAKTTDGGETWRLVYSELGQGEILFRVPLMSMTFLDGTTGFIVGGGGKILKTSDGGNTWQKVTSPTTNNLRKIVFVDNLTGFIAGEKVMLKTTNGGTTWTATSSAYTLYDLHFFNASSAVATTLEGFILKTVDGGANWTEYPVNFNAMLGKMAFQGQTGYVVAYEGLYNKFILKTTDGGNLWEKQFPAADYNLVGITIAPGGRAWTGGLNGKIFATSNGGGPAYPIASFKTSSTQFCQGLNYTFANTGPQNTYTYEWRIDGVLKATTYDFQTTFTPGDHTVELTAINGPLKGTSQLSLYVDYGIPPFLKPSPELTFGNGLCKGASTVITVKNPEDGHYKLFRGNELLAEDEYAYDGVYLPTPALQTSTAIRVTVTRSNRCETREILRDTTITVYNDILENSSIQAVQNYFCNSGQPAIQVTSSKTYLKYDLFNQSNLVGSMNGNGQTIAITAPTISDTTKFTVKVSVINGTCAKWFADTVRVNVEKVKADFHLSTMNAVVMEPVNVYNNSDGATNFQWTFNQASPSTSNSAQPGPIQFQQPGTLPVTLNVSSPSGCSDAITKSIYSYHDAMLKPTCWGTGVGVNRPVNGRDTEHDMYDLGVMPDGDVVTVVTYVNQAELDSKVSANLKIGDDPFIKKFLARYSSKGVLKWAFNISTFQVENTDLMLGSRISVGPDGSIYVLTSYGSFEPVFYSADGSSVQPFDDYYIYPASQQYVIKYNPDGILQWVKPRFQITNNMHSSRFAGLEMDNAGNLYVLTDTLYKISPSGNVIAKTKVLDTPAEAVQGTFNVCGDGSWYYIGRANYQTQIRKYSSSNQLQWENKITNSNYVTTADVEPDNSLVITGTSTGTNRFQSQGESDHVVDLSSFFMAKYNPSGKFVWLNKALTEQVEPYALAIDEQGQIAVTVKAWLGSPLLQSQDGNNVGLPPEESPHIVKYDTDGNYINKTKIFTEPNTTGSVANMVSRQGQVYVNGLAFNNNLPTGPQFGPVPVVNGDLVYTPYEHSYFLGKFESGVCEMMPVSSLHASFVEMVMPEDPLCPGSVLHVTYEATNGTYIEPGNIFTVYLTAENGAYSMPIGSLASNSTQGTIEVTIPEDITSDYFYNVAVWASKPKLYSGILNQKIAIKSGSQTDFTFASYQDLVYEFSPSGFDPTATCKWTIEGKTIEAQSHTYKFSDTGLFEVCLFVIDGCGIERTVCKNVYVTCAQVLTDYTYTINDKTVTFTGLTNPSNIVNWNFGDGSTATTLNAVHTFANYGEHWICFRSFTECNQGIACKLITLTCAQGALTFGFTPTEKNVQFTNTSAAEFTQFEWNFGDGTYSAEKNPLHAYAEPGTYAVTLLSTGNCGVVKTVTQNVTVTCLQPTADFQSSKNGLIVTFSNLSSNATGQTWDFGDGTFDNTLSPQHTFASPGSYSVCLTAKNSCTQKTTCKTVTVSFPIPIAPTNLIATALSGSSIGLQWSDNSTNEESFKIWYKETGAATFQTLTTRAANTTQYTADNLWCNKSYTFKVSAVGQGSTESGSNEAIATTMPLPATAIEIIDHKLKAVATADQYQWYVDNAPIPNATNQEFTPEVSGFYKVELTKNGCSSFSSPVEFIITGTEDNLNSGIVFYPIPATDKLTIDFNNSSLSNGAGNISFFNATGNLSLQSKKLAGEKVIEISTTKLTSGFYVLVIDLGQKVVYKKITIQ